MITQKAMNKYLAGNFTKEQIENITTVIAAKNVLITDITKKGELVLKHLD